MSLQILDIDSDAFTGQRQDRFSQHTALNSLTESESDSDCSHTATFWQVSLPL